MSGPVTRQELAHEADFPLAGLTVRPSLCRIVSREGEIRVEALTMSLLVVLTRNAGATVTREQLVRHCWQGRFVSDDAIARAISKVRGLGRRMTPAPFVLETVPKVGYRLVAAPAPPVASTEPASAQAPAPAPTSEIGIAPRVAATPVPLAVRARHWLPAALAVAVTAIAILGMTAIHPAPALPGGAIRVPDVVDALMNLDEQRVDFYLQQGWKPDWNLDSEGGSALTYLMLACERNKTHDQHRLLRVARLLVAAGADPNYRNKWGDSALIIARSPKYCGPEHPVVQYLRSISPASGEFLPDQS